VHQQLNKLIDDENDKFIKTKQINEMEVIEVPEKLNDEGQENITLQKLIDFQEPKEKATISRMLRIIKMCKDQEEYDILQELNETKCIISYGQLLNVSSKVRSQVSQGLKLEKPEKKIIGALNNTIAAATLENNIDHSYISKRKETSEEDIAMVDVTVDENPGKALIDSCSNLLSQKLFMKNYLEIMKK